MKNILFLLVAIACSACGNNSSGTSCKTEKNCLEKENCNCYCSQKCGYRKKMENDHPVYVEKDANKKFCYCKQWDLDNYQSNCIEHKNIQQPLGSH